MLAVNYSHSGEVLRLLRTSPRPPPHRYAPTPHSPQGRLYGFATQKGLDANHDYVIAIKERSKNQELTEERTQIGCAHAKSEALKVKWWVTIGSSVRSSLGLDCAEASTAVERQI